MVSSTSTEQRKVEHGIKKQPEEANMVLDQKVLIARGPFQPSKNQNAEINFEIEKSLGGQEFVIKYNPKEVVSGLQTELASLKIEETNLKDLEKALGKIKEYSVQLHFSFTSRFL